MRTTRIWLSVLTAVAIGVAGCTGPSGNATPPSRAGTGERMKPLVDQFRDARARARSDFEREALDRAISKGRIEPADYEEAFNRYRRCATDAKLGETYAKLPNGIYRVSPPADMADGEAYAKSMSACAADAGLMSLEALYRVQVDNPDLLADPSLVVVRCLVKAGLVGADYTVDKLNTFLQSDMSKATDFDPMEPEAQKCLTAGGIAVQLDRQNGGA